MAGHIGSVQSASRGADQQIGFHPPGGEGLEHAHLDRSEAPSARQYERGDHRDSTPLRLDRCAVEGGRQAGKGQRREQEPEVAQRDVVIVRLQEQVGDDPAQPSGDQVPAEAGASATTSPATISTTPMASKA